MPVQRCVCNGKPGYRYGTQGACYRYTPGDKASMDRAKQRAHIQGYAVEQSQKRRGKRPG